MRVPRAESATVSNTKLEGYLLSPSHPVGRFKAAFFKRLGFTRPNAEELKAELLRIIREHEIVDSIKTNYGVKYRVDGKLRGSSGNSATLVTVWIADNEAEIPTLITAYPGG